MSPADDVRVADVVAAFRRSPVQPAVAAALVAVLGVVLALVLPTLALPGALRLTAVAVLASGAWLTVHRIGLPDLSLGGIAVAGAWSAALLAESGAAAAALLPVAALVGAAIGAASLAVAAIVGRVLSALTTLALGTALVAVVEATDLVGAAGYHSLPLVTGSDRGDLAVGGCVLALVGWALSRMRTSRPVRRAVVAVRAPHVLRAEDRSPVRTLLFVGAVAGAVLGLGGALVVTGSGSLVPAGFGLPFTALVALTALLAGELQSAARLLRPAAERARSRWSVHLGATPLGFAPLLATLGVVGPGVFLPTVPFVGTAPALLVTGPPALVVLAYRRREQRAPRDADEPVDEPLGLLRPTATVRGPGPRLGTRTLRTSVRPGGPTAEETAPVELVVEPGEVVGIVGPNGAGKSTALARIGGQLPSVDPVRVGDQLLGAGPGARARAGLARSWQQAVDLGVTDPLDGTPDVDDAVAWAIEVLGDEALSPAGVLLQRVAAARPSVVLLDEPGAELTPSTASAFVRGLAAAGVALVVVEHREELLLDCDRVVDLEAGAVRQASEVALAAREADVGALDVLAGDLDRAVRAPAVPDHADGGIAIDVLDVGLHAPPGRVTVVEEPEAGLVRRALAGQQHAAMTVDGRPPTGRLGSRRARVGLYVLDASPVAPDLTVRDHLRACTNARRADRLLAANPLLADRGDDVAGVLSGGERQALAWTMLRARRPRAVVLDHPTRGLDTGVAHWLGLEVRDLAERGAAVMVLSGNPVESSW